MTRPEKRLKSAPTLPEPKGYGKAEMVRFAPAQGVLGPVARHFRANRGSPWDIKTHVGSAGRKNRRIGAVSDPLGATWAVEADRSDSHRHDDGERLLVVGWRDS